MELVKERATDALVRAKVDAVDVVALAKKDVLPVVLEGVPNLVLEDLNNLEAISPEHRIWGLLFSISDGKELHYGKQRLKIKKRFLQASGKENIAIVRFACS